MITINGRFLTQNTTGVQRFAREVLIASRSNKSRWLDEVELATPSVLDPAAGVFVESIGLTPRPIGTRQGHLWEQVDLHAATIDRFLVNLCNTAPILKRMQLVVLHDAAVAAIPKNFSFRFRAWYQLMIRSYGVRAAGIATVSQFSAQEIARYFGIPRNRLFVIPESGEHILRGESDKSILERLNVEPDSYFLAVSSMAPSKNFGMVVEAVSRMPHLPFRFLIVGGRNAAVFGKGGNLSDAVVEAGYVSDGELRALYEHAACFIYPSLYEGFGLPPLEAMSCGCPVIASNAASLPEVCGTAAVYVDPRDPSSIADALSSVLRSPSRRLELRESGLGHAKQWTWKKAASRLEEIISDLDWP